MAASAPLVAIAAAPASVHESARKSPSSSPSKPVPGAAQPSQRPRGSRRWRGSRGGAAKQQQKAKSAGAQPANASLPAATSDTEVMLVNHRLLCEAQLASYERLASQLRYTPPSSKRAQRNWRRPAARPTAVPTSTSTPASNAARGVQRGAPTGEETAGAAVSSPVASVPVTRPAGPVSPAASTQHMEFQLVSQGPGAIEVEEPRTAPVQRRPCTGPRIAASHPPPPSPPPSQSPNQLVLPVSVSGAVAMEIQSPGVSGVTRATPEPPSPAPQPVSAQPSTSQLPDCAEPTPESLPEVDEEAEAFRRFLASARPRLHPVAPPAPTGNGMELKKKSGRRRRR
jgi:hypothetical protein